MLKRCRLRGPTARALVVMVLGGLLVGCTADSAPVRLDREGSCAALKRTKDLGGGGGDPEADRRTLRAVRGLQGLEASVQPVRDELVTAYTALVDARAGLPAGSAVPGYEQLDAAVAAASRRLAETCP